ncbi:MAG: phosphatase [Oligoflexia bacterium]|nr:MAG: phosphatase [Oligoflexia bacterium]
MKVAALDLGSNTFLLLICEVNKDRIEKIYEDQVQVVRLGQGVNKTKKFHPEALQRAERCLSEFSKTIAKHRPEKILAMATSAARDVVNGQRLFELGEKYKIPIQIIPGEKEAQISYEGATSGNPESPSRKLVIDIGGGSTELILGQGQNIIFAESIDVGCVRLKEMCISQYPVPATEFQNLKSEIEHRARVTIQKIQEIGEITELLAVAGTPTELARVQIGGDYDPQKIDGYKLRLQDLQKWQERLKDHTTAEVVEKYNLSAGRADVILIGVMILIHICEKFRLNEIVVSTRGVRHGVALEMARA